MNRRDLISTLPSNAFHESGTGETTPATRYMFSRTQDGQYIIKDYPSQDPNIYGRGFTLMDAFFDLLEKTK